MQLLLLLQYPYICHIYRRPQDQTEKEVGNHPDFLQSSSYILLQNKSKSKQIGRARAMGKGTEAFPDLGEHCKHEDCNQLDFLPFTCDGCHKVAIKSNPIRSQTLNTPIPANVYLLFFFSSIIIFLQHKHKNKYKHRERVRNYKVKPTTCLYYFPLLKDFGTKPKYYRCIKQER